MDSGSLDGWGANPVAFWLSVASVGLLICTIAPKGRRLNPWRTTIYLITSLTFSVISVKITASRDPNWGAYYFVNIFLIAPLGYLVAYLADKISGPNDCCIKCGSRRQPRVCNKYENWDRVVLTYACPDCNYRFKSQVLLTDITS